MKKYLALMCAALLCACSVALAACGGGAASSSAASASSASASSASASSASASASASASSAAAKATVVGTWQFAGAEMQGITVAGDLSGLIGEDTSITMVINEGGTGTIGLGSDVTEVKWTETPTGMTVEVISPEDTEAVDVLTDSAQNTMDFTLDGDVLSANMDSDGQTGTAYFTHDGVLPGFALINPADGKPITSEADLVGKWNLTGLSMMGLTAYGPAETIAEMAGWEDASLVLEAGGTGTFAGEPVTFTVGADGAAIDMSGMTMPLTATDKGVLMDMSDLIGMDMAFAFEK